jgi:hypothetical protein
MLYRHWNHSKSGSKTVSPSDRILFSQFGLVQSSYTPNTPIFVFSISVCPFSVCPLLNQPVPTRPIAVCSCKPSISCKLLALYVDCVKEDDFSGSLAVREVKVWGTVVVVMAVTALTVDSGASGVLDSTGEGVSVVDCVIDGF